MSLFDSSGNLLIDLLSLVMWALDLRWSDGSRYMKLKPAEQQEELDDSRRGDVEAIENMDREQDDRLGQCSRRVVVVLTLLPDHSALSFRREEEDLQSNRCDTRLSL